MTTEVQDPNQQLTGSEAQREKRFFSVLDALKRTEDSPYALAECAKGAKGLVDQGIISAPQGEVIAKKMLEIYIRTKEFPKLFSKPVPDGTVVIIQEAGQAPLGVLCVQGNDAPVISPIGSYSADPSERFSVEEYNVLVQQSHVKAQGTGQASQADIDYSANRADPRYRGSDH